VGWSAAIFSRSEREPAAALRDLFIDAPLDSGG
jgi:hypothetical protein